MDPFVPTSYSSASRSICQRSVDIRHHEKRPQDSTSSHVTNKTRKTYSIIPSIAASTTCAVHSTPGFNVVRSCSRSGNFHCCSFLAYSESPCDRRMQRERMKNLTSRRRSHARAAPALALSTTLCSSFTSFALSNVV